ncbi:MAG: DUF2937 family protein [Gammaproteobacteria bacterium]|nr:DUF2937 family protein [Gammaproteobacteria bacterium]
MVRSIIFITVFISSFLIGGLFPSFSTQYHLRLQAQYDQVSIDLAPFEEIARKFHGGSMDALIQHHLDSTDPTFHGEGEAIQLMVNSQTQLAQSKAAAEAPYVNQVIYFYQHADERIAQSTMESFTPTLVTTENAITFALAVGTIIILVFWAGWVLLTLAFRRQEPGVQISPPRPYL